MSIDNFFWVPAGIRNKSMGYKKYKSWADMVAAESPSARPYFVFLAQGGKSLVDEQYFFESADDALWFWDHGYQQRLFLDDQDSQLPYDRMALWIDDQQVAYREYKVLDECDT